MVGSSVEAALGRIVACIAVALLVLVAGCADREAVGSGTARAAVEGDLYALHIRVHPGHAQIVVSAQNQDSMAVIERRGPLATFHLPRGAYDYEVRATGYRSFEGAFMVPDNKNLEVWLATE